jgi:hypothetical protein
MRAVWACRRQASGSCPLVWHLQVLRTAIIVHPTNRPQLYVHTLHYYLTLLFYGCETSMHRVEGNSVHPRFASIGGFVRGRMLYLYRLCSRRTVRVLDGGRCAPSVAGSLRTVKKNCRSGRYKTRPPDALRASRSARMRADAELVTPSRRPEETARSRHRSTSIPPTPRKLALGSLRLRGSDPKHARSLSSHQHRFDWFLRKSRLRSLLPRSLRVVADRLVIVHQREDL